MIMRICRFGIAAFVLPLLALSLPTHAACEAERARANGPEERAADTDEKAERLIKEHWRSYMYARWAGQSWSNPAVLREYADSATKTAREYPEGHGLKYSYLVRACLARARADRLERPQTTVARPPSRPVARTDATAPRPAPTPGASPGNPASSVGTGTAGPPTTREAMEREQAQARQRQAALDEQRQGRPKRHYADREAHHCLNLVKENTLYGGFTNTCSFPVRFAYCAYKPKRDAWTESFDCEKAKSSFSGINQIKPGERSAHHTLGAQRILWFACRADSSSDEIFEVGDASFDPSGPVMRARCVKWGERS